VPSPPSNSPVPSVTKKVSAMVSTRTALLAPLRPHATRALSCCMLKRLVGIAIQEIRDSASSTRSVRGRDDDEIYGLLHPKSLFYRYTVLFLCCMITFGSYYCYDIPGALKKSFFERFTGLTQLQYNLMYSLYSWPNVVQVFIGGYVIDRYLGVRWGCALCCIVLCIGQLLVTAGTIKDDVFMCLAGRFIFGIGGETLTVAQASAPAQQTGASCCPFSRFVPFSATCFEPRVRVSQRKRCAIAVHLHRQVVQGSGTSHGLWHCALFFASRVGGELRRVTGHPVRGLHPSPAHLGTRVSYPVDLGRNSVC
jgi:hypothetical protein